MDTHEHFMKRALKIAEKGWGKTNPNPLVGAVIVKDNEIIAEGFHEALGCAHAEVAALKSACADVRGSTLYVNLEPCSHYGRTPPCAKAIIDSGIKNVVVGMVDPNPKVSGNGIKMLKDADINITVGVMQSEAEKLNEIFINYITRHKPFVIMKAAMTLDGKIASVAGDSKWVSNEFSRNYVHLIRDRVSSIMVGINTVVKDNPSLTARLESKECTDPVRIIVDSKGRIPLDSNVIQTKTKAGTIMATTALIDKTKEKQLIENNVRIIKTAGSNGNVDLRVLMDELYKLEIDSVLLEGGGTLNYSALEAGIVDKVMFFISPKIIGGKDAVSPVEGAGIDLIKNALKIKDINLTQFDDDILIEGYIS